MLNKMHVRTEPPNTAFNPQSTNLKKTKFLHIIKIFAALQPSFTKS